MRRALLSPQPVYSARLLSPFTQPVSSYIQLLPSTKIMLTLDKRKRRTWKLFPLFSCSIVGLLFVAACNQPLAGNQTRGRAPTLSVRVINTYPHDSEAFIQGLVVEGETIYEGTGQYGRSTLRRVDLTTGKVQAYQPLNENYFGEGITILDDKIFQLTWKRGVCVVWDKESMKGLRFVNYRDEGWGLTSDGKVLYMSDGSSTIRVLDPNSVKNFKVLRRIRVKEGSRRSNQLELNELEWVKGFIYANVWYQDRIAKIDPKTGAIVAWIDCSGIYPANTRPSREHVLNGIAYDAKNDRLFVTGKNWPKLYEIKVLDEKGK